MVSCINYADVTGTDYYTGGIIGFATNENLPSNDKIVINGCHNKGNITGNKYTGGICGLLLSAIDSQGAQVTDSSNEGKIVSNNYAGGLFGLIKANDMAFSVERVCNYGDVVANSSYAGGIAGEMYACFSTATMNDLYNVGSISANTAAGGLAGLGATGTLGYINIENFYNLGKLFAINKMFAGIAEGKISGWFGHEAIRIKNAYYDKSLVCNDSSITEANVIGLEQEQFKLADCFEGFDFDNVWGMTSYGPVFLWQSNNQKCGENVYWSVSGDLNNLTLNIYGFGDTYDYDINELSPWHYKYKIKNVVIGDKVTSIGSYLFAFDSNIKSVNLGKCIGKIKKNSFLDCEELRNICIPSSVSYIGDWCFNLSGLEQIEFEGDAPQMFDCTFYGLTLDARYDSETNGWEDTQKKSYGGNITWLDMYGTFKPNYVTLSRDLLDGSLPGIPSRNKEQYINEFYSWAIDFGYDDVLTKDKCREIIDEMIPSVVAEDEDGTYVTYMYSTEDIMRDILMINSTKKSLIEWERNDIINAESKNLSNIHEDVNKIIEKYNEYEEDAQRSALSSTFYTLYSSKLLKTSKGVVVAISKDYFLGDIEEDLNNLDFGALYEDFYNLKLSSSNWDMQFKGMSKELSEIIKEEFPKKFTKEVCRNFIGRVIEKNDDVNSFVEVYKEISGYANSFKGDSLIAQFGSQTILPLKLLEIYVDLMQDIDEINQGKYFMLQYSLMRYYPDLYDQIIDKDGNVIDLLDSYILGIESAFVREQIDNWYNNGGSSTQLTDKQKVTLANTAALVMELQNSDPLSMKRNLVEYWYEYVKCNLSQKNSNIQSEIIMTAASEFHILNPNGDLVGVYKDNEFQSGNSINQINALASEEPISNPNREEENNVSEVLYSDDDILVELGATHAYVHILFTQSQYRCIIDSTEGVLLLTDVSEKSVKTYKYSTLDPEAVILIDGDTSIVLKKDGEVVLDDSEKEINDNQGSNMGGKWNGNFGGECTSGGSTDKITEEITTSRNPNSDVSTTFFTLEAEIENGKVSAMVKTEYVTEAIKQIIENKSENLMVNVSSEDSGNVDSVYLIISKEDAQQILDKTEAGIVVETMIGDVIFSQDALKEVVTADAGRFLTIGISRVTNPTKIQQQIVGENGHIVVVTVFSQDKEITSFGGRTMKIRLEIPDSLLDKDVVVVYIAEDGSTKKLFGDKVTEGDKQYYEFETTKLSTFALIEETEAKEDSQQEETPTVSYPKKGTILTGSKTKMMYKITKAGVTGGTVAFVGTKNKTATTIIIPVTVTFGGITYKVTSIAAGALKNNKVITKVVIGKNVTVIGTGAFSGCTKLKSVTIGKGVVSINSRAFYNCTSLTTLTIPANVTKIWDYTFKGCNKLSTLKINGTKLTTKTLSGLSMKGISTKTVIKVPKSKVKAYKTLFVKKGLSKKVTIKGL